MGKYIWAALCSLYCISICVSLDGVAEKPKNPKPLLIASAPFWALWDLCRTAKPFQGDNVM